MATRDQFCHVYIQLPGAFEWVPCASLRVRERASGLFEGTFTYDKGYLARANVVALDPFHLPLSDRPHKVSKLKGIPGAVRDAGPDYWGRHVMRARLERPEADLLEVDYLLNGPDDGAGNLRFGLTVEPPNLSRPFNRTYHLQTLIDVAQKLEEEGCLPYGALEGLEPGTRMGGARPKVAIEDGHHIWLAKLPEKNDRHNMQRIEYATLELARVAGLRVCGARLEKVADRDVLMLERFDREWDPRTKSYARYGLVSALTVLDADDGYLGRERWSYLLLADELRRWSTQPDEDRKELFLRMAFNAMVTNNDDHPRNHALLRTPGGWRLSPAYDIVPVPLAPREQRDLALNAGRYGHAASLYNLLSECAVFGLSREQAKARIEDMLQVVRRWRELFALFAVEARSLDMLEAAILPASFFLREPPGNFRT